MKTIKISKESEKDVFVGIFIFIVGVALVLSAILLPTSSGANSSRKEVKLHIISPKGYSKCNIISLEKVKEGFVAKVKGPGCFIRKKGKIEYTKYGSN